jgi:hypothetical protein
MQRRHFIIIMTLIIILAVIGFRVKCNNIERYADLKSIISESNNSNLKIEDPISGIYSEIFHKKSPWFGIGRVKYIPKSKRIIQTKGGVPLFYKMEKSQFNKLITAGKSLDIMNNSIDPWLNITNKTERDKYGFDLF